MKLYFVPLFTLILVACTVPVPTAQPSLPSSIIAPSSTAPMEQSTPSITQSPVMRSAYPDLGPAPELAGDVWLNSEGPLRLSNLRGKVVLVDMWTFG
jgi:hypothetical protein